MSGTYQVKNGIVVLVSDRIPQLKHAPAWAYKMDAGLDSRMYLKSLEDSGRTNDIRHIPGDKSDLRSAPRRT